MTAVAMAYSSLYHPLRGRFRGRSSSRARRRASDAPPRSFWPRGASACSARAGRHPGPLPGVRDAWLAMDVRDEAAVARGSRTPWPRPGRLDAVVCCAGYSVFGSVEELSLEKAREQFETNLMGTLDRAARRPPHLRGLARTGSWWWARWPVAPPSPSRPTTRPPRPRSTPSTLALRMEVAPFGVGVSLVEPGDIRTPFNDHMDWGTPEGSAVRRAPGALRARGPRVAAEGARARGRGRGHPPRAHRAKAAGALHGGTRLVLVPLARRLLPDWLSLALIRDHFKV